MVLEGATRHYDVCRHGPVSLSLADDVDDNHDDPRLLSGCYDNQ